MKQKDQDLQMPPSVFFSILFSSLHLLSLLFFHLASLFIYLFECLRWSSTEEISICRIVHVKWFLWLYYCRSLRSRAYCYVFVLLRRLVLPLWATVAPWVYLRAASETTVCVDIAPDKEKIVLWGRMKSPCCLFLFSCLCVALKLRHSNFGSIASDIAPLRSTSASGCRRFAINGRHKIRKHISLYDSLALFARPSPASRSAKLSLMTANDCRDEKSINRKVVSRLLRS